MSADAGALELRAQAQIADEPVRGQWALILARFRRHKMAVVSAFVLGFIFIVAAAAPLVAPYNPDKTNLQLARFGRPAAPSLAHPMGSDNVGRDRLRASSMARASRWWSAFWRPVSH